MTGETSFPEWTAALNEIAAAVSRIKEAQETLVLVANEQRAALELIARRLERE